VWHIVKQSVMGAVEESCSLAKVHRPVEKAIESSGLVRGREPRRFAEYVGETAAAGVWDVEAEEATT